MVGDRGLVSRWVMPFSRQIRSNSTSAGAGPAEPAGELLADVAGHFAGDPVLGHHGRERQAYRPGGSTRHHGRDDAEPGVVVDPGDDLALAAAGQEQARRDIELPQLHRSRAFPPAVLVPAPAPRHRLKQLMTDQHPVNRRPGHPIPALAELEDQAARAHRRCEPRRSQITASTSALIRHRCDLGA
jgi:hypothetical protein